MKKLISFAVAGMFALSLAACGSSSSAAASITESSAESTAASLSLIHISEPTRPY